MSENKFICCFYTAVDAKKKHVMTVNPDASTSDARCQAEQWGVLLAASGWVMET